MKDRLLAEHRMNKIIMLALLGLVAITSASAATQQGAASKKTWAKYYAERLPEAKQALQACVAKGFNKVEGEEKIKCEAARDAWHFQPYKPKQATFLSSGGRN